MRVYIDAVFTIKQLSDLAGVTPRTLRHYDEIGLLKPSRVGSNGYRYYDEPALLRLQQILFYRELDVSLDEIRKILSGRDFDVVEALQSHRKALSRRAARLAVLIQTVDDTISHLKGRSEMNAKALFHGFTEEEEQKYAEEALKMYDLETVKASNKKWKSYSKQEKERIANEGVAIYSDLLAAMPKGAASPEVQGVIARWHRHIQHFWSPIDEQLLGLTDVYNNDPRFRKNFDEVSPQLAGFMRDAVEVYVESRRSDQ